MKVQGGPGPSRNASAQAFEEVIFCQTFPSESSNSGFHSVCSTAHGLVEQRKRMRNCHARAPGELSGALDNSRESSVAGFMRVILCPTTDAYNSNKENS